MWMCENNISPEISLSMIVPTCLLSRSDILEGLILFLIRPHLVHGNKLEPIIDHDPKLFFVSGKYKVWAFILPLCLSVENDVRSNLYVMSGRDWNLALDCI